MRGNSHVRFLEGLGARTGPRLTRLRQNRKEPHLPPNWKLYERLIALLESENSSGEVTVVPNAKLKGVISGIDRQIDVLIDSRVEEDVSRRIIVDAKLYSRKINIKDVEEFEGMMRDCRAQRGVLVCPHGYSDAALRRAQRAITIKLVTIEELESVALDQWDTCLGSCRSRSVDTSRHGCILWDRPLHVGELRVPMSIVSVGKCDECSDFMIWCWACGQKFALEGDNAEGKCKCEWFWLTATESEGIDQAGNELSSVVLIVVMLNPAGAYFVVDRRPLN
jgi:hypothetical protein